MQQRIVDVFTAHGEFGRSALFGSAHDDRTRVTKVCVFNNGLLIERIVQKVLQATGAKSASAEGNGHCAVK